MGNIVEMICFLRGLLDARIIRFLRSWLSTGMSRGKGPRGAGLLVGAVSPDLTGRSPCSIAASS